MAANLANAFHFLLGLLLQLYLALLLLRVLLQMVQADFYNPISQVVWRFTNPLVMPLRSIVPKYRHHDIAGWVVVYVYAVLAVLLLYWSFGVPPEALDVVWYTLVFVLHTALKLYTVCLFAQAILSWVGPGLQRPGANVLYSLNEPLLRPVRRYVKPVSGIDLSPLVLMLVFAVLLRLIRLPGILQ